MLTLSTPNNPGLRTLFGYLFQDSSSREETTPDFFHSAAVSTTLSPTETLGDAAEDVTPFGLVLSTSYEFLVRILTFVIWKTSTLLSSPTR